MKVKTIYFIEDKLMIGEGWKAKGEELGLFKIIHFLSPFDFFEYAKINEMEKNSFLVVDKFGPGYDNEHGFLSSFWQCAPNYTGKKILVSNSFVGNNQSVKGFDLVLNKRDSLEVILDLIENEK